MKAVQVRKAYDLVTADMEKPVLSKADEVLVKVKRVGICGSDMHIYHGTNPLATLPRVIGHEVTGEVEEVGANVKGLKAGDHVVIEPISYCGNCYACRKGRPNVCAKLSVFGVHEDGGMREYVVLPEKQLHAVSKELPWEEAVMAEPYTIGAQAVWRGQVEKGDRVLIQGAGPIGICVLKMAKLAGASVMITDLNNERLTFATENGADAVVNVQTEHAAERVREWTGNGGANVVIDAVCLPATFELSVDVVSPAGRVVVLGFDERASQISQLPITKKEVTITGSRLQTNQFPKVVKLLNEGRLAHNGLVTHTFSVEDVHHAFQFIKEHPDQVRKAVITFD
ncbi:zinc-binding alcohol dehydrogenase family protein [Bacillus halotolerans]|uniref:zinc-binding alcohol dehydrogenase family protein n=1 Tax=Bacillus halotolerans TaxID=260554 RepID=UPI002DBE2CC3|nr:zinc-binding alcohol dehydrogenase family protein [Bacillus halotolerans]MEC3759393.1 zinc-binding alcohol dehydrogenase family protein [Bacillus halotolerans]